MTMDDKTPFYEARIAIPCLQYKIFQFIQQQVPELEEEFIRKVLDEAFKENSKVLRSYIDQEVREAFKDQARSITRELMGAEFREQIENRVRKLIVRELHE